MLAWLSPFNFYRSYEYSGAHLLVCLINPIEVKGGSCCYNCVLYDISQFSRYAFSECYVCQFFLKSIIMLFYFRRNANPFVQEQKIKMFFDV